MKLRAPTSLPLLLILAAAPPRAAAEPGWTSLGPEAGQRVVSLAVLPGAPPRVFAGASSGVFRTVDGTRWDLVNGDGLPLGASGRLHSAPAPGSPIYLATYRFSLPSSLDGVFRSDDGGVSWTTVRRHGGRLAVAPSDPSRLYLATGEGLLETSRDGGDTWTPAAPFPLPDSALSADEGGVAVAPSDPETVFVLLRIPTDHGYPDELRLLRSDDGGGSWEVTHVIQGRVVISQSGVDVVLDPEDPSTIYPVLTSGVYRSRDGGATWEPRSDGLPAYTAGSGPEATTRVPIETLVIDPEHPSTLYAGLATDPGHDFRGGVYRSTDGGATWTLASGGLPLPMTVHALAFDPGDSEALYAGTPRGVFRSPDGGAHWSPTPGNLPTPVASVAIDPRRPARLFAGADNRRLFVSDDGGQAWRRSDEGILPRRFDTLDDPIAVLTIAPSDPSVLFMSASGGFFADGALRIARSTDGGATWELLRGPGDVRELVVDPRDPKRVLAAVYQIGGVFASDNLGGSWQRLFLGRVQELVQAPSNPDVLYAGTLLFGGPDPARVCRSVDGGVAWECTAVGFVTALAVDPRDASVVLAAVQSGDANHPPIVTRIERSLDGGVSWSQIAPAFPEGVAATDLAFDPRNAETVWLASLGGGVFRGTDGGASWTPVNRGLMHPDVNELAFDPSGRVLAAATRNGLFRFSTTGGPAPPAGADWLHDAAVPGFRVKVRIDQGGGATIPGTKAPVCIPETICVAGALPARAELFVRMVGPKPNGRLWPTLVKFSTSRIEVWIQQLSTGELRYYELRGASPGVDELPGLFDRSGFLPE